MTTTARLVELGELRDRAAQLLDVDREASMAAMEEYTRLMVELMERERRSPAPENTF